MKFLLKYSYIFLCSFTLYYTREFIKTEAMNINDITFKTPEATFNYRVGAVIIDSGSILMVKNSGTSFYYSVGGRVKLGESAREAVLREAYEETRIIFEIDRLLFIHENFFTLESNCEYIHEVALFFLLKSKSDLNESLIGSFLEEYGDVTLHWLPIADLGAFHVYPDFFINEIKDLPENVVYYITRNDKTIRI